MFIDTHCHLDIIACFGCEPAILTDEKIEEISKIIDQACLQGVKQIINVGCDVSSSLNSTKLARRFASVFAIVGMHPYEGISGWRGEFDSIEKILKKRSPEDKIVGVGEIGLDYSRADSNKTFQKDLFKIQIDLALENNLPISFHVRDAADDFLRIVEPFAGQMRGVVHCFQQDQSFADEAIKFGLLLGIDGPITYPKNAALCQVVSSVDLSKIILETDAPFLPVQQERGKMNYPSKIPLIADKVAQIKNVSLSQVEQVTTKNALTLFSLPPLT